jgi:hypothetical protein
VCFDRHLVAFNGNLVQHAIHPNEVHTSAEAAVVRISGSAKQSSSSACEKAIEAELLSTNTASKTRSRCFFVEIFSSFFPSDTTIKAQAQSCISVMEVMT